MEHTPPLWPRQRRIKDALGVDRVEVAAQQKARGPAVDVPRGGILCERYISVLPLDACRGIISTPAEA